MKITDSGRLYTHLLIIKKIFFCCIQTAVSGLD